MAVDNDQMKAAADAAAKPPAPIEEPVEAPALSPHIPHAELRYGRAQVEVRGYELAIAALETEARGAQQKADSDITRIESDAAAEIAEIEGTRNRRVARIKEDLVAEQSSINKRLDDLREARDMMQAVIDLHAKRHPKPETDNAETDAERDPPPADGEDQGVAASDA